MDDWFFSGLKEFIYWIMKRPVSYAQGSIFNKKNQYFVVQGQIFKKKNPNKILR